MKKFFEQKKSALVSGMNSNKGFSLVELIIVVAIMAVLMGVLAPQYLRFVESSREQSDATSANSIKSAMITAMSTVEGVGAESKTGQFNITWTNTAGAAAGGDGGAVVYNDGTDDWDPVSSRPTSGEVSELFFFEVYQTIGDLGTPASTWAQTCTPTFTVHLGASGTPEIRVGWVTNDAFKNTEDWASRLTLTSTNSTTTTP